MPQALYGEDGLLAIASNKEMKPGLLFLVRLYEYHP